MTNNADDLTDYGFENVPRNQKISLVKEIFASVASRYDLMNDVMSFGLHRCWKKRFIYRLALAKDQHVLDVAAGTGDITISMRQIFPYLNLKSYLVDLTPEMIVEGKKKAINAGLLDSLDWYVSPAESLPFDDNVMDIYTISFGLRNVSNRDEALKEAFRVLKPGGRFYCLEFSHVENSFFKKIYELYSFGVLPTFGEYIAKDRPAYQYLVESIRRFPTATALTQELQDVGFMACKHEIWSEGIVAMHSAQKPYSK